MKQPPTRTASRPSSLPPSPATASTTASTTAIAPTALRRPAAKLPAPYCFGFRYTAWRPHQEQAINEMMDCTQRISAHILPTGSGKTLIYLTAALLSGRRVVILTSTKGLMDQILRDFGSQVVEVRGANAYPCTLQPETTCDLGPCRSGERCSFKGGGCLYFDAVTAAKTAPCVVTNYAFWMSCHRYGTGLGEVDMLVLDEAHAVPEVVSSFLEARINPRLVESLHWPLPPPFPTLAKRHTLAPLKPYISWAKSLLVEADELEERIRTGGLRLHSPQRIRQLRDLCDGVFRIAAIKGDDDPWIVSLSTDRMTPGHLLFTPVWVAPYIESAVFRSIPRVVLTSATANPKTLALLGLKKGGFAWYEAQSTFPAERHPLVFLPTVRLNHRTEAWEIDAWLRRIAQIVMARADRKGIIHTVSYDRAALIAKKLYTSAPVTSGQVVVFLPEGTNHLQTVERFKQHPGPAVLLSPAVTTGFDFPYTECEYQIVAKLGFPDSRNLVIRERQRLDRDYSSYVAMLALVQAAGRGMRAADDACETFVLDSNLSWFLSRYSHLAPVWFTRTIRRANLIPPAPNRLEHRKEPIHGRATKNSIA